MSADDIALLRANDLCVVVSTSPAEVKFVDPLPAQSSRTQMEHAAIQLSRKLLTGQCWDEGTTRTFAKMYVDILVKGTPLDSQPTQAEQEKQVFDVEKRDELRRLAREEAKAERAEAKSKGK